MSYRVYDTVMKRCVDRSYKTRRAAVKSAAQYNWSVRSTVRFIVTTEG